MGVFITMNPGYAGRTELPDNLKVQFRPVAMMVPDYTLIAEIMLYAEGFGTAKKLSGKFTKLYRLSSEQLSKQDHYDFGMRAVKSVLVMAGSLKRSDPDLDEDILLIRAMRDSNVPKFLADDLPLFAAIVSDMFPGVEVPFVDYGSLLAAIEHSFTASGLQVVECCTTKTIQLFETFNVRFGVMIVGFTMGGKTTLYRMLAKALTKLRKDGDPEEKYQEVRFDLLNPKCISMGELYGEFNELTQEWTDGLASTLMRNCVADDTKDYKWTIFDGPVDAIWIESMNTVLDDNMTLCLANGERIKLKKEMRMLFEVNDLAVASPATVSRCGMVYVTFTDLGWRPLVTTWLAQLPENPWNEEAKGKLNEFFEKYVDSGVQWVRKNAKEPVPTYDNQLVVALMRNIEAITNWDAATANSVADKNAADAEGEPLAQFDVRTLDPKEFDKYLFSIFCWAFCWSIGASSDSKSREKFAQWAENVFDANFFPRGGGVFDGYIDFKQGFKWRSWDEIVPSFVFDAEASYFDLLVPNQDTVRFSYLQDRLLGKQHSLYLTGSSGVGKSVIVQAMLSKMKELSGVVPFFITFSAQTNALMTQTQIEAKLEKKRKTLLGAPVKKTVVLVVDDVNMPLVEEYGAQPPIELLRLFQDHRGFYDRNKLFWKEVENTTLLLVSGPPGGGRNAMTPRFQRHSNIVCMPNTSEEAMVTIFSSIFGDGNKGFASRFKPDIAMLGSAVVTGTMEIYNKISEDLLPTPTRSHYLFNLRDVSKVFQGILMVKPMNVNKADVFSRLWLHETQRVFCDRLIDAHDKDWFEKLTAALMKSKFRYDGDIEVLYNETPAIFTDCLRPGADTRVYEECADLQRLGKLMEDYIDDYNLAHSTPMTLVFFKDALEHITRILRLLRQERGSAMLVGVGGSGRQSLTRLSASISEMNLCEIEIIKGYDIGNFKEDEKTILTKAGGAEGNPTVFLMNDTQIIKESFLEDINNILNAGEVTNLFPMDEMDRIVGDLRPMAKELQKPTPETCESKEGVWAFFVSRVRQQLHIVLAMSPVGDAMRVRFRMFPSLINCATVDWFQPWPEDALREVATRFLAGTSAVEDDMKENVALACVVVHKSVHGMCKVFLERLRRHVYVTPKSYLDLIQLYMEMLVEKQNEMNVSKNRLSTGLTKIGEANAIVESLQEELTVLQPILVVKKKEAEEMIIVVTKESGEADIQKDKVGAEERIVRKQADEVRATQLDAQRDLDIAMPALEKALKSLDALDKKDITEIKSFSKPPPLVMMTMEAVNVLLGEKPDWDSAKKVLNDSAFLDKLRTYDKDNIPQAALKKLSKYVVKDEYQPDVVGRQSSAAKSLCMWTHAMDTYSKVAKEVAPKKAKLEEMNRELNAAEATLQEKRNALQQVLDKVAALQKQLEDTEGEKNRLIREAELTQGRLKRADVLTVGLKDEAVSWTTKVGTLTQEIVELTGDVFMAASSIAYYGPFTGTYRNELVQQWTQGCHDNNIPCGEAFNLSSKMGNPLVMREWAIQGLPSDSVSLNNGVMVVRTKRWPLLIDPQEQGTKWIKKMEGKELKTLKLSNSKLLLVVENCIRVGAPLFIEDIAEMLDPGLEPVLQKAVFNNQGRMQIHLGDSDVDYDPNFKLYISTKMANPHYFPEVCIKVTVINFTVTFDGLEEQLLAATVERELPQIVQQQKETTVQLAKDMKTLEEMEAEILRLLSESSGNILDDQVLIDTLGVSKKTSVEVKERVATAKALKVEIEIACNRYMPVATRGSIMYFVIADLANIDPMYQFSLFYVLELFGRAIDNAQPAEDLMERLMILINDLTFQTFLNVCRGLFERHKLIFSFMIASQILIKADCLSQAEFSLLLRGIGVLDLSDMPPNPLPDSIPPKQWEFLYGVQETCDRCGGLCDTIAEYPSEWEDWWSTERPEQEVLPMDFQELKDLTFFHKLLIVKALAPEKVFFCTQEFVKRVMGEVYVVFPASTMDEIYVDSTEKTPVIFILSTGADPTAMLYRFAVSMGVQDKLAMISLGQGQGPKASRMLEDGMKEGNWVVLQNCHLCASWMPTLERTVEGFEDNKHINKAFRLFLTSMPAPYFPVPVLQNGVKLTTEPPNGIRANLKRSLMPKTDEEMEKSSQPVQWRVLQLSLMLFHSIVQERRKFGPLGWNNRYEFNDSDLECATTVLYNQLELGGEVPWETLQFVVGQINYGGRVTDDNDRKNLMATLGLFLDPDIMNPGHTFSPSGIYQIFNGCHEATLKDFNAYVDSLPLVDPPEIFGMHENANIAFQQQESDNILEVVLSVQPRVAGGGGGKTPEEIVTSLATNFAERVPDDLTREGAHATAFIIMQDTKMMESMGTCLGQEMARFNNLLGALRASLGMLKRAIAGFIVMTAELDGMFQSFMNNKVPKNWEGKGYPSLKPLSSWYTDMVLRVEFFHDWISNGKPYSYWISSFFFPQGFLTSVLQAFARSNMVPVDILSNQVVVQDFDDPTVVEEAVAEGILVHGAFMDGCAWSHDLMVLDDQQPGIMYVQCPVLHMIPTPNFTPDPKKYFAPFYKTSERRGVLSTTGHSSNFIMTIEMDTDQDAAYWILKGAALLSMLND
jgi:dynein heavy chain